MLRIIAGTARGVRLETPPETGEIEVDIPEDENECLAFIPAGYHPSVAHGLVIWLHTPGEFDKEAFGAEQQRMLVRAGCHAAQGYRFARPLADPDLDAVYEV